MVRVCVGGVHAAACFIITSTTTVTTTTTTTKGVVTKATASVTLRATLKKARQSWGGGAIYAEIAR